MSQGRYHGRTIWRSIFRATFSGLKVSRWGMARVIKCELEVELRPLSERSELFGIYSMVTDARISKRGYPLRDAKAKAAEMFEKQITEWEEIRRCSSR